MNSSYPAWRYGEVTDKFLTNDFGVGNEEISCFQGFRKFSGQPLDSLGWVELRVSYEREVVNAGDPRPWVIL